MKKSVLTVMSFALASFALAGCNDAPGSSHTHTVGEHGICSECHQYAGQTKEFRVCSEDNTIRPDGVKRTSLGELETNQTGYFRVSGFHSGHGISIDETNLWDYGNMTAYTRTGDEWTFVNTLIDNNEVTLGEDGYLYFELKNTEEKKEIWIELQEVHHFSNAGVCSVDGTEHKDMHILSATGSTTQVYDFDRYNDAYFKFTEAVPGHKYTVNASVVPASMVKLYYINSEYEAVQLTEADPVPEGVTTIYAGVHITNMNEYKDASFQIVVLEHSGEHGYCSDHEVVLPGSVELSYEVESDPFDLAGEETKYFNFDLTALWEGKIGETLQLRFYCDHPIFDVDNPKAFAKFYIHNVATGFEDVSQEEIDDAYQIDMTIYDPGDAFKLFIEVTALEDNVNGNKFTVTHW